MVKKRKSRANPGPSNPYGLPPRQWLFCQELVVDENMTAAYLRAGYKDTPYAHSNAARFTTNDTMQRALADLRAAKAKRLEFTADRVLQELAMLAFSDIGQMFILTGTEWILRPACDVPESMRRALVYMKTKRYLEGVGEKAREVEVTEFKVADKLAALVKYGQHLGLFTTKVEHSGAGGGAIPIRIIAVEIVEPAENPDDAAV